jgi:hypothetical protein
MKEVNGSFIVIFRVIFLLYIYQKKDYMAHCKIKGSLFIVFSFILLRSTKNILLLSQQEIFDQNSTFCQQIHFFYKHLNIFVTKLQKSCIDWNWNAFSILFEYLSLLFSTFFFFFKNTKNDIKVATFLRLFTIFRQCLVLKTPSLNLPLCF